MARIACTAALSLALVLAAGAAHAVTISWTISGDVSAITNNAGGALDPFVALNDAAVLTFDVESDATDTDPSGATGRYAASNLVFTIGSLTFTDASFELRVDNGGLDGLFINSNDVVLSSGGKRDAAGTRLAVPAGAVGDLRHRAQLGRTAADGARPRSLQHRRPVPRRRQRLRQHALGRGDGLDRAPSRAPVCS